MTNMFTKGPGLASLEQEECYVMLTYDVTKPPAEKVVGTGTTPLSQKTPVAAKQKPFATKGLYINSFNPFHNPTHIQTTIINNHDKLSGSIEGHWHCEFHLDLP
jgi:hypothetical protein